MKTFGREINSIGADHKREGYIGPISSTGDGGKSMNVNNLNDSQLRGLMTMAPYGIASRGKSGMKAQVVVNDNSNNAVVGVYDPKKPEVEVGEIVLYSIGGCTVYLDKNGDITMKSGSAKITMDKSTGNVSIDGDTTITGDVNIVGSLKVNGVSVG